MTRDDEHTGSREGLLHPRKTSQLRSSLDEAYKSSSEDDFDLDLDFIQDHNDPYKVPERQNLRNPRLKSANAYENGGKSSWRGILWLRAIRKCLRPTRTCLVVSAILVGGLVALVVGSGAWVYKSAPIDGVSCTSLDFQVFG